jgi:chromosome condensin MukBEF ATPase and DNA-binding subunit MukB
MVERVSRKGKRPAVAPVQRGRGARAEPKANAGRLEAVERERDQLKAQLADAQALIGKLQQARDEAVIRIDWAIDSLHNVLESDA